MYHLLRGGSFIPASVHICFECTETPAHWDDSFEYHLWIEKKILIQECQVSVLAGSAVGRRLSELLSTRRIGVCDQITLKSAISATRVTLIVIKNNITGIGNNHFQ